MKLGEPVRDANERSVEYVWDVAVNEEDGSTKQAVLSITYRKPGANYYSGTITREAAFNVSLRSQSISFERGFRCTSFGLFQGLKLATYEAPARFSRKQLDLAATRALSEFLALVLAKDERLTPFIDSSARTLAALSH
jgi:hypothetical protein